jgi:hypothetical protein
VDDLMLAIIDAHDEALRARTKWSTLNSAHEGYGVLAEEFRELERHVFTKQGDRDLAAMRTEAIQIAATALRIAAEVCNEQVGRR